MPRATPSGPFPPRPSPRASRIGTGSRATPHPRPSPDQGQEIGWICETESNGWIWGNGNNKGDWTAQPGTVARSFGLDRCPKQQDGSDSQGLAGSRSLSCRFGSAAVAPLHDAASSLGCSDATAGSSQRTDTGNFSGET